MEANGTILAVRKRRLRRRLGLAREPFDRSFALLPRDHHGDAARFLLRRSERLVKAVLKQVPAVTVAFTHSVGETHVHVADVDVSNPSPGAYSYTLAGDQRKEVLDASGGWITDVSYRTKQVFDWDGLKSFIDSLTDEDSAESIAAKLRGRGSVV